MNKAFVREPDDTGQLNCPRCGSLGVPVERETWSVHLRAEAPALSTSAFFCPFGRCEVVYFDMFERTATVADLARAVWPKDPEAPLCGCFGLTADDVEADLAEGSASRVRELLAKSKSPAAQCRVKSPCGQCCMPQVQQYYMRRKAALEGG